MKVPNIVKDNAKKENYFLRGFEDSTQVVHHDKKTES